METKKMSLANIQGKISRAEMKNIMAGSLQSQCAYGPLGDSYCRQNYGAGYTCNWFDDHFICSHP